MNDWIPNLPDVMSEFCQVFDRYERALVANDVPVLDELFYDSPNTVRYGLEDEQYGMAAVKNHRAAQPAKGFPRELLRTALCTWGHDLATAQVEFWRPDVQRRGRQSQTWIRTPAGWRVVSAHVSWGQDCPENP